MSKKSQWYFLMSLPAAALGSAFAYGQDSATPPATPPTAVTVELKMEPGIFDTDFVRTQEQGYRPWVLPTSSEKPAAIAKEPAYVGKPLYGAFRMGNGPKNLTYCVVDEPAVPDEPQKIYVDTNQNGDLTDDGPGTWDEVKKLDAGVMYYETTVDVHGSWGTAMKEEVGSPTKIFIYRRGTSLVCFFSKAARSGSVTLGDKTSNIVLRDDSNDGVFYVTAGNDRNRPTPQLLIDLDGDGFFKGFTEKDGDDTVKISERLPLNSAFKIGDQWWIASPTLSGDKLTISPSSAASATPLRPTQPELPPLLAAGTVAPDFSAIGATGEPLKLSDFKGKVVILDFWATWCAPCQASMPKLQKTYDTVRDQGVVVLSLCVWDDKSLFDAYIEEKSGKDFNFTFGFDPKGREDGDIAKSLYKVSGIPTMYVIDRDGKISAGLLGAGKEKELAAALQKLEIKLPE